MGSGVGSATAKVGIKNLPESINYIWEEYIADSKNNSLLSYEMNQKTLTYLNKSLAFDYLIKGDQNKNRFLPLYIILHNGGISQPSYNNGEFLKARFRYQSCIQTGIICGVRGVTDLSNMHYSKVAFRCCCGYLGTFIWKNTQKFIKCAFANSSRGK